MKERKKEKDDENVTTKMANIFLPHFSPAV